MSCPASKTGRISDATTLSASTSSIPSGSWNAAVPAAVAPVRAVLFHAADDDAAGDLVADLIRAGGFDPVRVGGPDQSIRLEVLGDLHERGALGRVVTKSEALKAI